MITLDRIAEAPSRVAGACLTIGNFDGVHLGHAQLAGSLRAMADALAAPAIALTFDPHPVALLRPEAAPVPLVWTERKVALLKAAGVDDVGVFQTGPWLLGLSAREFFDRIIRGQFAARGIVEGSNFAFGRGRGGDAHQLRDWCADAGLRFASAPSFAIDGALVSSSRIRALLAEGDADAAARMLGRPHRLRGIVTHGAGRGAGLGIPTANLDGIDVVIPFDGVYAGRAILDDATYPAALNIGPNPTFGEQIRKVEAHLVGFDGDLYGRTLAVDVHARLRPARRFDGIDDLLAQIREDIARTVAVVAAAPYSTI